MEKISRRSFGGHLAAGAAAVALGSTLELAGCSASTDLEKVLALLPTVGEIAASVGSVIAAVDPGIGTLISAALKIIGASFTEIQNIVSAYQSNIAGMPPTIINKLDAAVAAVSSELSAIEAQIPGVPAIVAVGINVGLAAFQAILGYLAAVIPAPVAAANLKVSYPLLSAQGVRFGVAVVNIPTPRQFAESYNSKIGNAGFSKARIHVPWIRVKGIPVLP